MLTWLKTYFQLKCYENRLRMNEEEVVRDFRLNIFKLVA